MGNVAGLKDEPAGKYQGQPPSRSRLSLLFALLFCIYFEGQFSRSDRPNFPRSSPNIRQRCPTLRVVGGTARPGPSRLLGRRTVPPISASPYCPGCRFHGQHTGATRARPEPVRAVPRIALSGPAQPPGRRRGTVDRDQFHRRSTAARASRCRSGTSPPAPRVSACAIPAAVAGDGN